MRAVWVVAMRGMAVGAVRVVRVVGVRTVAVRVVTVREVKMEVKPRQSSGSAWIFVAQQARRERSAWA